ncbi:MAG TPA: NYN domain-containing protein [Blastocatellia bacterium]|nr:NYN domain-containing protein [Blastocatellia bacterium]
MAATRGKTICFIDNANVFYGQTDNDWRIDWEKFQRFLEKNGEVWQTYFFASETDPPSDGATAFYQFLKENLRWEVRLYTLGKKTVRCNDCGHEHTAYAEKGVDVGLATTMLMLAVNQAYDTAILVSGDRDYIETVQHVKNRGLRVEVISWRAGLSGDLETESSAPVIYLDDLRQQIEKQ